MAHEGAAAQTFMFFFASFMCVNFVCAAHTVDSSWCVRIFETRNLLLHAIFEEKKNFFPLPQSSCPADSDLFTIFCPRLIFFSLFLRHYRLSLSRLSVVLRHRHHPHLGTRTNISKQTSRAKKKSPTCRPTFFSRFVVICSSTQNVSLLLSCQRLHFLTFFTLSSLPPSSTTPKRVSLSKGGEEGARAEWEIVEIHQHFMMINSHFFPLPSFSPWAPYDIRDEKKKNDLGNDENEMSPLTRWQALGIHWENCTRIGV